MTDHRAKHAKILGYFLILSSIFIFIYSYFELVNYIERFGAKVSLWETLSDTVPFHIFTIFTGLFSLKLSNGLQMAHSTAVKWWTLLCLFLLGDSIYTLTIQFHILIFLKAILLSYLTGYALIKYKQKYDGHLNAEI